jgi:CubicO group peptidase (beta-lactamase class C family)
MNSRRPDLALLAALSLALATLAAVPAADDVDDYLATEMRARHIPGLTLAVVRNGTIVRTSYHGLANVELDAPVVEHSVFAIASLDKELTAAGVMRLVEGGRVTLDDRLTKYVDGPWGTIALRHLLTHTSGLPDQVAGSVEGRSFFTYTTEQLLSTVRELEPVAPPGVQFVYSDANFFLLQLVTERASGEPWRHFIEREIFAPAGMRGATFMDPSPIRRGRVSPYTLDEAGTLVRNPSRDIDYGPLYNDLGMPVRAFASWLAALDSDRPLTRASRDAMWTPVCLHDGGPAEMTGQWRHYGFGFGLDRVWGHRVVTHSGFVGVGFVKFPDDGLSVVVFTNLRHGAGSDPIGLAYGVAGTLLPDVSLRTRPTVPDVAPARTNALREEYERLLAGEPGGPGWARDAYRNAWESGGDLSARQRQLGSLDAFDFLGEEHGEGGGREAWYRARHANGRIFLRFALDPEGRIAGLQWYHV